MLLKTFCIHFTGDFAAIFLIVGISLAVSNVFEHFAQSMVKKEVVLKNGTEVFEAWENPPAPVYMQFYFFNLTNPQEMLDGERPAVVEIGPYTYREYRPMEEVIFQDNGTKVTAVNTKTYIFQPNMSWGPESDLIRTVNIPAITVMENFKNHTVLANLISAYMKSKAEGLFVTRTVGELLWGYEDGLLKAIKLFIHDLDDVFGLFYKSVVIDDTSATKLKVIVVEHNVLVNIPFMLIGAGIILGIIFMFLICQKKPPESTAADEEPLLTS
ncbi:Lysosome membrane protein 2 85 kDa lysosomal membrane sialoglycoprotein [Channa argus]|uniref:Lysosome membrane protein 2 85 kDa lysosomal membrane sialoglycoprotein n=1 Tax=Channa argus TaxID=215402 RepID=A0A6G1QHE4_CHAAH|nr:Lysosome membrane protein 2 85 kDa lysosomal membrane sialoglycoprotein [Channa argus]